MIMQRMALCRGVGVARWVWLAALLALVPLIGCCPPPRHGGEGSPGSRDPREVVRAADKLAAQGRYEKALREYLWALDHGVQVDEVFHAVRNTVLLDAILNLGAEYPPARAALRDRHRKLGESIRRAADSGCQEIDNRDLDLFVELGTKLGEDASLLGTYEIVKLRLHVGAKLRQNLWTLIEQHLVEQRRYQEAAKEHDVALGAVQFKFALFKPIRPEDELRHDVLRGAIESTIERNGGVHFEALLGAGQGALADEFAEELIEFRPTGHTFATLIRHARRAGASDVAIRLRTRAYEVVPQADRALVDKECDGLPKEVPKEE